MTLVAIFFRQLFLGAIRFYQRTFSPDTGIFSFIYPPGTGCKFHPTCSNYASQAIAKYGALKGSWLGLKRLARCHPFSKGGYDPLP